MEPPHLKGEGCTKHATCNIDLHEPIWREDIQAWDKGFIDAVNYVRKERIREFYEFNLDSFKNAWKSDLTERLTHHIDIASLERRGTDVFSTAVDETETSADALSRWEELASKTPRFYWDESNPALPPRFYWEGKTVPPKELSLGKWWLKKGRAELLLIVENPRFDWLCLSVVFANSMALAVEDPENTQHMMVDVAFNIIFTAEMLVRLLALGRAGIWRDLWCRMDSIIVFLSWVVIILEVYAGSVVGSAISGIRAIRIVKILKTFKFLDSLKDMIRCIFISLIRLRDVLLFVLFFIYAMSQVGMQLFRESSIICHLPSLKRDFEQGLTYTSVVSSLLVCTRLIA